MNFLIRCCLLRVRIRWSLRGRDARATKGRELSRCGRLARHLTVRVVLVTALVSATLIASNSGAAEDVILRTSVTPEEAWVGQRVLFYVEVLGADGWAQITDSGKPELQGAYVMRTESQGVRLSETIARTSYTGQRYQLSIYCQRPGRVEIPPGPVTVTVKQWGINAAETSYVMTTPSASLVCKVPPGAEGIQGLISTNRLEARQSWSSRPETATTGDAITRKVTLSAEDVSGMAFPPMQHPEIEGVGIYPGQPTVTDQTDRGSLRGEREESVTYVFEEPGDIALPAIVLPWWDIDAAVLQRIELPGLELIVEGQIAPDPVVETEVVPTVKPRARRLLAAVAVVLIAIGLWLALKVGRWLQTRRRAWLASEEAAFKGVNRALRGRDPATICAAVMRWLDRLDIGTRPARLDLFLEDYGDEPTRAAAAVLAQRLATGERFTEPRSLARGLKKARKDFRQALRARRIASNVLPELNGRAHP